MPNLRTLCITADAFNPITTDCFNDAMIATIREITTDLNSTLILNTKMAAFLMSEAKCLMTLRMRSYTDEVLTTTTAASFASPDIMDFTFNNTILFRNRLPIAYAAIRCFGAFLKANTGHVFSSSFSSLLPHILYAAYGMPFFLSRQQQQQRLWLCLSNSNRSYVTRLTI